MDASWTTVVFRAEIKLDADDIRDAEGDLAQAIQNQIGHTGAQVIEVEGEDD